MKIDFDAIKKTLDEWSGIVSLFLSPLLAFWLSRDRRKVENKKLNTEAESVAIANSEKVMQQWAKLYDDIKKDYKDLQLINDSYAKQIGLLIARSENNERKIELQEEKYKIIDSKLNNLQEYTQRLQSYTIELEEYTKEIKDAVEILILEIEKTNPDFAIETRLKIKEALRKLENAKKPTTEFH